MDLNELEAFLHLAGSLHFGRASTLAHLSTSALSRTIQRLEQEAGRPLFERAQRTVRLTPEGIAFRVFAQETLARWSELRAEFGRAVIELRGEITLYGSVTAACVLLPPLLEQFRRVHPGVTIRLRTGNVESAIERVQAGEVDAAIVVLPDRLPAGLASVRLTTTELEFMVPKADGPVRAAAMKKGRIDWETIPFIAPERGVGRRRVEAWFRAKRVRPNIVTRVSGGEAILGMVALGFGVGVVSRLVAEASAAGRQVEPLPVKPRLRPFQVALVGRRSSPPVGALLDLAEALHPG